jgi:hypothetical protein
VMAVARLRKAGSAVLVVQSRVADNPNIVSDVALVKV